MDREPESSAKAELFDAANALVASKLNPLYESLAAAIDAIDGDKKKTKLAKIAAVEALRDAALVGSELHAFLQMTVSKK